MRPVSRETWGCRWPAPPALAGSLGSARAITARRKQWCQWKCLLVGSRGNAVTVSIGDLQMPPVGSGSRRLGSQSKGTRFGGIFSRRSDRAVSVQGIGVFVLLCLAWADLLNGSRAVSLRFHVKPGSWGRSDPGLMELMDSCDRIAGSHVGTAVERRSFLGILSRSYS